MYQVYTKDRIIVVLLCIIMLSISHGNDLFFYLGRSDGSSNAEDSNS